jgi:hypothetical protein
MSFAELELERIDRTVGELCRRRCPPEFQDRVQMNYRIVRHDVIMYETQPGYRNPNEWVEHGVAKLRFVRAASEWRLFWLRASLRWQSYEPYPSSRDLKALVDEIDRDPHGCFFG